MYGVSGIARKVTAMPQHRELSVYLTYAVFFFSSKSLGKAVLQMCHMVFLAHLSQSLIGELIGYSWSGVRSSTSSTMLKDLLPNRFAIQSQNLCRASLGRGNDILFTASGSHDQDGRHAHIWYKPFKNLLQNRQADFQETWYVASGTPAHHSLFK